MTVALYGSVEQVTSLSGIIRSGGVGNLTQFSGSQFWAQLPSSTKALAETFSYAAVTQNGNMYYLNLYDTNGTRIWNKSSLAPIEVSTYGFYVKLSGFTAGTDYVDLTPIYGNRSKKVNKLYGSVNSQTKKITKLYGSVNGQTKLIYSAP